MTNLEYEHSFNVKNIEPYIDFCKNNGFVEISVVSQNRIVFENKHNNKIIARLTTEFFDNNNTCHIDFKNVSSKQGDLNISTESMPLKVKAKNKDVVLSILSTLDFVEVANNLRTRYVYTKENVTFEIDDYTRPQMKVVAIEGKKEEVEFVYNQVKNLSN